MTLVQTDLYGPAAPDLPRVCELLDAELATEDRFIQNLLTRITNHRGKMLRPVLVLLSARASGWYSPEHLSLAAVVEMVHLASLVHDDVIDEAEARRCGPSVNRMIGNEGAVLLGDYIIAKAFHLCSSLRSHTINDLLTDTCKVICLGELLQVSNRRNLEISESEYLDIISKKTAWLMRTCGLFGTVSLGVTPEIRRHLGQYGLELGMAFQISDDVLDLYGSEEEMGKTVGHDLAKGELTLPLIHFLQTAGPAARREMVSLIGEQGSGPLGRIRELLGENSSPEYCLQLARDCSERAVGHLNGLPASEARDAMVALAEFVINRRS
jgi:octaprenyl-diphosphate synthase